MFSSDWCRVPSLAFAVYLMVNYGHIIFDYIWLRQLLSSVIWRHFWGSPEAMSLWVLRLMHQNLQCENIFCCIQLLAMCIIVNSWLHLVEVKQLFKCFISKWNLLRLYSDEPHGLVEHISLFCGKLQVLFSAYTSGRSSVTRECTLKSIAGLAENSGVMQNGIRNFNMFTKIGELSFPVDVNWVMTQTQYL